MTAGTETRAKIQSLAQLCQTGYRSPIVDATIAKLVAMERARLAQEVASLAERLRVFEERYQRASVDCSRRFQAGELGDDADLFEWSAFYHLWVSARAHLTSLGHETTSWRPRVLVGLSPQYTVLAQRQRGRVQQGAIFPGFTRMEACLFVLSCNWA